MALLDVCMAIRRLETRVSRPIRRQLAGNEKELERGIGALERAEEKLHRIKNYLKAATALLKVVGKVVKPL